MNFFVRLFILNSMKKKKSALGTSLSFVLALASVTLIIYKMLMCSVFSFWMSFSFPISHISAWLISCKPPKIQHFYLLSFSLFHLFSWFRPLLQPPHHLSNNYPFTKSNYMHQRIFQDQLTAISCKFQSTVNISLIALGGSELAPKSLRICLVDRSETEMCKIWRHVWFDLANLLVYVSESKI